VQDKVVKVIIDGGSYHNLASREMVDKLGLKLQRHSHPYHVQWLNDLGDIKIGYKVKVPFKLVNMLTQWSVMWHPRQCVTCCLEGLGNMIDIPSIVGEQISTP